MTEIVLAGCVFFTFMAVVPAAFLSGLAGIVLYKYLKQLDQMIAAAPKQLAERINLAVAEFVEPYKQAAREKGVAPHSNDTVAEDMSEEEFEEWMYR